jgi:hypothetical protein
VYPRGEGDARGDFDAQFEAWYAGLWDALGSALGLDASTTTTVGGPRLTVEVEQRRTASPILQSYRGQAAMVRVNRELTARAGTPGARSVRHLEITLPAGTTYAAGDHLGVLPRNDVSLVNRVLARFGLDAGQYVTLTATGSTPTHLPVGEPYPLLGILAGCVELQDVASRAGLTAMVSHMPKGAARDELAGLAETDDTSKARYREKIAIPRHSLLDLLEEYPVCDLPFAEFLDRLPALHLHRPGSGLGRGDGGRGPRGRAARRGRGGGGGRVLPGIRARAGHAGLVKLVVDTGRGLLVGATAVGPAGGEVLGLLALAVHARVPVATLESMILAYPTFTRGVRDALVDLRTRP